MLYNDINATISIADHSIDRFMLFDYAYPDCRIEFDLFDYNLLKTLVTASVWGVELIYFDSHNFYKEKRVLWEENRLMTRFKYFVDPTYYPDTSMDMETVGSLEGPFMSTLTHLFQIMSLEYGSYTSSLFKSNERIGILLGFQRVPYDWEYLDEILLELNSLDKDNRIQSVRIR